MSKLARRAKNRKARRNPAPYRDNPPLAHDLLEWGVPGLAAFAATRFGTRGVINLVGKKWPSKSKHVGAALSLGTFLASWWLGHRVKFLEKYHAPITVGAGIAAAINLVQIYVPWLGALVGDPIPAAPAIAAPQATQQIPANMELVDDDPAFYTYNDAYDAGRLQATGATKTQPSRPASSQAIPEAVADLFDDDNLGVFAGGLN